MIAKPKPKSKPIKRDRKLKLQAAVGHFWSRVDRRDPDECWPWLGCCDKDGYGRLTFGGRLVGAHRVAWLLRKSPQLRASLQARIPKGKVIRHMCHNPACCNPRHLRLGTVRDNYYDSVRHGTARIGIARRKEKAHAARV